MPDILKQIGPEQVGALQEVISEMGQMGKSGAGSKNIEDDDDVPPLIDGNFENAGQQNSITKKKNLKELLKSLAAKQKKHAKEEAKYDWMESTLGKLVREPINKCLERPKMSA